MRVITFDIDWASDNQILDVLTILGEYELRATFFATHDSTLLRNLDPKKYEISLHPNYFPEQGTFDSNALNDIKRFYPNSIGMRSHSLTFSSRFLPNLRENGIEYESNIFLDSDDGVKLYRRNPNLISIPFNWSDDKYLEYIDSDITPRSVHNQSPGLHIYNFHPVHIYINSHSQRHYEYFKLSGLANLPKGIYKKSYPGIREVFMSLCEEISRNQSRTLTMKELLNEYK